MNLPAVPWPFKTMEDHRTYERTRKRAYAQLRKAHEMWMAALKNRKEENV